MADLKDRLRSLDDLGAPPDILKRAEAHGSRGPAIDPGPSTGRKFVVIGVAFVIATAAIGFAIVRLQPQSPQPVVAPAGNLVVFTAGEPPPSPTPNGDGFVEIAGPQGPPPPTQVYVASPDGSFLRALTDDPAPKGSIAWSPDGVQLAFTAYDLNAGVESLSVIAPDGSGRRVLCERCTTTFSVPPKGATCVEGCYIGPSPLPYGLLAWSPDGRWIASRSQTGLALIDPSSGAVRDVRVDGDQVWGISWSRDSSQLAVTVDGIGLVVADVASGQSRTLVTGDPYGGSPPAWSPGGATIAFARRVDVRGDAHAELEMVDAATGTSRTVLGADRLFEVYDLAWSPDSSRIAVLHHPVDPPTAGLLTMNADGSDVRMVALCENGSDRDGLCTSNGGSVDWSPDGTSLLFDNFDGDRDAVATLRIGGSVVPVSGGLAPGCCLAWQPSTERVVPSVTTTPSSSPSATASIIQSIGPVDVGVPGQTTAIAATDNAVWVGYYDDAGGHLAKLDPETLETVAVIDDVPRSGIEAGGDGLDADVTGSWIAGEGQLVRVDESKDRVAKRISLTGTGGADVSIGGFGLWVLEEPSSASGALIETFDPMSGAPDVSRELSCSFPRRIVEVGGFVAVVSLDMPHIISAGAGVEPRLRLLDWEAGGDTVGPSSGTPFPSTELASSDNGWTLDGSTLVELDGIERLRPIRSIDLPVERPVSIAVGAGGVWVVSQSGELLRVDEDSGELDVQMEVSRGAGGDRVAANDEALFLLGSDGRVVRIAAPA